MPEFSCPTCHKVFKQQAHLDKHARNKRGCSADKVKAFVCGCGKCYSQLQGLSRHKKGCVGQSVKLSNDELKKENEELKMANDKLQQRVMALTQRADLGAVQHVTDNSTITTNNNTTNITNIINLNCYGREDQSQLESLSFTELKKVLKLTPDHESLIRMICYIHLNKDQPQNRTLDMEVPESPVMKIYKKGAWTEIASDVAIYDLICRNCMRFIDLEATLRDGMTKSKFAELTEYLGKAEEI